LSGRLPPAWRFTRTVRLAHGFRRFTVQDQPLHSGLISRIFRESRHRVASDGLRPHTRSVADKCVCADQKLFWLARKATPARLEPAHTAPEAASRNVRIKRLTWPNDVRVYVCCWNRSRIFRIMVGYGGERVRELRYTSYCLVARWQLGARCPAAANLRFDL
jgi:hypothetical protein